MRPLSLRRLAALPLLLLLAALPASSQQVITEPVRLPAAALMAPVLNGQMGVLASPTLKLTLTPSLQVPTLSASLITSVQAPTVLAAPQLLTPALGQAAPQGSAAQASQGPAAMAAAVEMGKSIAEPHGTPVSQTLSSAYDGRRAAPAVSVDAAPAAAGVGRLAETQGLTGTRLLSSLHQISGRNYHAHEYKDASQYLFGTAYNITSHGVRGVVDAYSGIFVPGSSHSGGDYSEHGDKDGDGFPETSGMNVEHTWPQSFFDKALPMRSDLHHLLPTFQHPNSMRSNLPFGEIKGQPEYSNNGGAKEGAGVFEPPNVSKGVVARCILYFYTRYYDRDITEGAYNHGFFKDRIDMFLRWNREHPPTPDEMRANDLIEKYQGNRNPYVDDFTLADRVGAEGFTGMNAASSGRVAQERSEASVQLQPDRRDDPYRKHGHHHHGRHFDAHSRPAQFAFSAN
jgi:hypothetical protein